MFEYIWFSFSWVHFATEWTKATKYMQYFILYLHPDAKLESLRRKDFSQNDFKK